MTNKKIEHKKENNNNFAMLGFNNDLTFILFILPKTRPSVIRQLTRLLNACCGAPLGTLGGTSHCETPRSRKSTAFLYCLGEHLYSPSSFLVKLDRSRTTCDSIPTPNPFSRYSFILGQFSAVAFSSAGLQYIMESS